VFYEKRQGENMPASEVKWAELERWASEKDKQEESYYYWHEPETPNLSRISSSTTSDESFSNFTAPSPNQYRPIATPRSPMPGKPKRTNHFETSE
jgi:hypothetical protein